MRGMAVLNISLDGLPACSTWPTRSAHLLHQGETFPRPRLWCAGRAMARLDRSTMASLVILGVPTVAVLLFTWFDHASPPEAPAPPAAVVAKIEVKPPGAAAGPASAVVRPGRRDVTV